ncbi:hypothetical protein [Sulfurovum sp.]|uniref:hypothetical protein n=1 Tax=Sulfurovum sp. TaxID=1969726 RepID=UPI0028682BED|nr:hypothetical protein [Sulfurovum sp.]
MNKGGITISIAAAILICMSTSATAGGEIVPVEPTVKAEAPTQATSKRQLKENMTLVYNTLPGSVDNIGDMFSEGIFYGRLRSNSFYWDWDSEALDPEDNKAMGMGGSLIYKSAALNGFSFTMGYYGSLNPGFFNEDASDVGIVKSGKDTFSRYKVLKTGDYGMHVLGEAYLEYNNGTVDVIAGRQLFESVFTASNDTKMIPNTFDGISIAAKIAPKTTARVAWFAEQKLRDHENAHDVVTFKDEAGESWNNNDDAVVHKGLSYANFLKAGEDPDHNLFMADVNTKYIDNLDFTISGLSLPGVVNDIVAEAHYRVLLDNGWAIRPGVRYFHQMDDGGGAVAVKGADGLDMSGKVATGYSADVINGHSLDSSLFAARVDTETPNQKGLLRFAYSKVADKADILAPWRGFPTGGFTRLMGQYNWAANTETYMVQGSYKFNPLFNTSLGYAIQDFDDAKVNVQADSNVWHMDNVSKLAKDLEMKVRIALVSADPGTTGKDDSSYNEYRLEFNYLF